MKKGKSMIRKFSALIFVYTPVAFFVSWTNPIWAAEYPQKLITLVVPYEAGGVQLEARALAPAMEKILGQNVVVEERGGGGGSIGTNHVVRSKPDGYILLYAAGSVLSLTPRLVDLPYGFDDLIPIASTSYLTQMLVVNANRPWKTIQEFVEQAKKQPGELTFGSTGTGSAAHIAGEVFAAAAKIKLTHVPFKGAGPAMTALLGGHIESVSALPQGILSQVRSGQVRALASMANQRFPDLPEVPTLIEAGIPAEPVAGINWLGVFAPKGTPPAICDKLTDAIQRGLKDPDTLSRLKKIGSLPQFLGQKEFKTLLERQTRLFQELIGKLNLKKK